MLRKYFAFFQFFQLKIKKIGALNSGTRLALNYSMVGDRGKNMNEFYQGCRINVVAELDLDADCWVPMADVAWEENGKQNRQRLNGPSGFFKIIDEAQIYGLEMAKSWVDGQIVERTAHDQKQKIDKPNTAHPHRVLRRYSTSYTPSPSLRR